MGPGTDAALAEIPLFAGLSPDTLSLLERSASSVSFEAGARLLRAGGQANVFYALRRGSVVLETYVPGRGPVPIETLEAGEVLGLSWMSPPYRWRLDARTLTRVSATAFDAVWLRDRFGENPACGHDLMARLSHTMLERLEWARMRLLDVYRRDDTR